MNLLICVFQIDSLGLQLVLHNNNLVDEIWGPENGQPDYPADPVFVLESQFAGREFECVVERIHYLKNVHITHYNNSVKKLAIYKNN